MSAFSKGDKVRCIETWTTYVVDSGNTYTVDDVRPDDLTDTMKALVNGQWVPFSYFEKVEPEDADDVEPEPLTFNDDDVQGVKVTAGSTVIFAGLAVFKETSNGNITVTPVPRCTSLFLRNKSEADGGIVRCGQHEGHNSAIHWTIGLNPSTSWPDNRKYGRLVESDGAS